jgi:hypothetical protein
MSPHVNMSVMTMRKPRKALMYVEYMIVRGMERAESSVSSAMWTWLSNPRRHRVSGRRPTMNDRPSVG